MIKWPNVTRIGLPPGFVARSLLALAICLGLAAPACAEPSDLEIFVMRHRCEVLAGLTTLYETTGHPDDRFLILAWELSLNDYVQCEFESDNSVILCEAASEFQVTNNWRVSPEGKAAIGRLGFSLDDSKGNFAQILKLEGPADLEKVARLMLDALYQGYQGDPDRPLFWKSAYAPRAAAAFKCASVS